MSLSGRTVLITGAARRIGRSLALAVAQQGGDVILHHCHSTQEAEDLRKQILGLGRNAEIISADLEQPQEVKQLIDRAFEIAPLYALVNNAAIFEPLDWAHTSPEAWNRHLAINLTAPWLLSQEFARRTTEGRIVNILDWRALRPGADHLPYTISKAGLAALTRSLAQALAPGITVNGLAFGAILPPSDGAAPSRLLDAVPARRWADLDEVGQALLFLLAGPTYITGEIIHLDGGRHLV